VFVLYSEKSFVPMTRTVPQKMGIKPGSETILVRAPESFIESLDDLGLNIKSRLSGKNDYIHYFFTTQQEMVEKFPKYKKYLKPEGMFWVSWPKSGKMQSDLSITSIIKIGYDFGLVESKVVSIDDTWSAIKFTFPREGKLYNNSYGKLKK
jgi:hypothetical protein